MKFYSNTIRRVFDNGMEAFFLPRRGGAVEVECYLRTGSIHEEELLGFGVSHFLEHMLFQGCAGYPAQEAASAVRALGGSINACTGYEYTMVNAQSPARHLGKLLEIIAAMVRSPELPEAKFELEKQVILRECDRARDQVSRRLMEELLRTVFSSHPLRHPICGYPELVARSSCDMLREYHRRRYTPERCFWVLAGDFEPDVAASALERLCGDWPRGALNEPALVVESPPRSPRSAEIVFPDPLARLALAVRIPDGGRLYDAAEVLFGMLGLGSSSHLVRRLELESGLAMNVSASCCDVGGFGLGVISASAVPSRAARLEKQLLAELCAVRDGAVSHTAVEREKRQKYAELLRQTGDLRQVAVNIGAAVVGGESPAECDRRIERMSALTLDDLRAAAAELLIPESFALVRQRPAAASSVRRRNPAPNPVLQLQSPGLAWAPDPSVPLVRMSLVFPGGTIFEPETAAGASALCPAWIVAGTSRLKESEFWERLESCGAELSVVSGLNSLSLSLSAPRRYFVRALKLAGDMLASPRFGDAEFERERARMVESCRCREQSPGEAAAARAWAALFGGHPYGRSRYGEVKTLTALTPGAVRDFYRSMLFPGRMFLAFGGDCSMAEAAAWRDALLREVKWAASAPELPAEPVFPGAASRIDFDLPREQAAAVLAVPGMRLGGDTDHRADILQHCENGLASHLFRRVREDNALSYSVGMMMNGGFHRGGVLFYALTSESGVEQALELLREEAARLAVSGVEEEEFLPAREAAAFDFERTLESGGVLLDTAVMEMYYGVTPERLLRCGEYLRRRTRKEFNVLLKELFSGALDRSVSTVAHSRRG